MTTSTRIKIFDVVVDFAPLRAFVEHVREGKSISAGNPIDEGIEKAAELYAIWLRKRFLRLSMTGGSSQWPDIEESTKVRKKNRGFDPNLILREKDRLMKGIGIFRYKKLGWQVGYVGRRAWSRHWRFPGTVEKLAIQLQVIGVSNGKKWRIVVRPRSPEKTAMINEVRNGLHIGIAQANRANSRGR